MADGLTCYDYLIDLGNLQPHIMMAEEHTRQLREITMVNLLLLDRKFCVCFCLL